MRYLELNSALLHKRDGFFQLEKDLEAAQAFEEEVQKKLRSFPGPIERLRALIAEGYYEDFFRLYREEDLLELSDLAYSYGFRFASFMAISKFYKDYALKSDDKKHYLERYEDRVVAVALHLAQGDVGKARAYVRAMMEGRYQPATPTFLNAGRARRGELVSCFLLELDDSLNSIGYTLNTAMQLSKIGGGVAINLSKLRGRGEPIKGVAHAAKGVVPVAKLFEDAFNYADQMGQRKGAGAVYLNIFHWDVEEFLDTKKINADEKSRLQTLSLGLIVPSKFFELAERGEDFYVFAPYSVYQAFGEHLDDMDLDRRYEELLAHPAVKKRPLSARAMLTRIAQTQFESGYPYLIYKSNANRAHPLKGLGQIKMSNLCTEIFQLQTTSIIGDYGAGDQIGYDISCNLGSLNIVNVMESKGLQESVHTAMDMLTAVSDLSDIRNAPGVRRANRAFHSVGLGAMNLHGYLAKNRIRYESKEARDFARSFFAAVNFYSIERSMQIARERGLTFEGFERSDYASGVYFEPYLEEDFRPRTEAVRRLFEGIALPTPADWARLRDEVRVHGLYHAYRLAIAPTASISYIQNATPSIAPIVDVVETRTYGNATTYYPAPFLSEETYWYYKSAYHINMYRLIDLVAEIQPHVDQGISTVLYVTSETSTRELARLYIYAWKKGLKSLYYTRTKNLSVEECISCAV
ncbi:MAG: class 1b ribonucleoside-diphosphate reductase subunit alpha [Meiothermus sp.]|uniref:class 1b ribonucleoside-diphosphate reductase subunit alpha n=1 Tax=Meiothermus sp. TaxID=1955249 RepID=UPI0025FBF30F|nr:class 1b ribonucleoside-diphosphate reductase subunit alpha [Meiothermus sp.]MCS7193457.1 class 1b ribonucleoside-diphosphate reductase subunit alpha [Meiothermus sp.]MDW8091339.1 class 1b ribonucleoside-diphosphate reductase subunit alpha [Meiothermus sp.]